VTAERLSGLQTWVLDEASDFPVCLALLVQPTRWVFVDDSGARPGSVNRAPSQRSDVVTAVGALLRRGLLEMLRVEPHAAPGVDPQPVPPARWQAVLDDPDTWRSPPLSPFHVATTDAGEAMLDAVWANPPLRDPAGDRPSEPAARPDGRDGTAPHR
jgi:hypothetical protein